MKSQVLIILIAAAGVAANGATVVPCINMPTNVVNNCNFATPPFADPGGAYSPVPGQSAWTFTGASGIAAAGAQSPWAPFTADGTGQIAFVQQQNIFGAPYSMNAGMFDQVLSVVPGTTYTLEFYYADRLYSNTSANAFAYYAPDTFTVSLNGTAIPLLTMLTPPAGTTAASFAYTAAPTYTFTATTSTVDLKFAGTATNLPPLTDLDTIISDVSLVGSAASPSIPEPGTFAMLIPALGGLVLAVRRRHKTQL